jgi:hypothetical protein
MNTHINFALSQRGITPLTFTCACCGDDLDRDDHMGDRFTESHTIAVREKFGPDVCFGCADDLVTCTATGVAVLPDLAVYSAGGEPFATQAILDEWEHEAEVDRRDQQAARSYL